MHDQQNIKICDVKQAKQVHHYKNAKIKLYKSNAAIWYNKTCRDLATCAPDGHLQNVMVPEAV